RKFIARVIEVQGMIARVQSLRSSAVLEVQLGLDEKKFALKKGDKWAVVTAVPNYEDGEFTYEAYQASGDVPVGIYVNYDGTIRTVTASGLTEPYEARYD